MKSLGRRGGFKCPACGYRDPALGKVEVRVPRFLEPGLYLQRPLAYRHLSPPAEAMGVEPVRAPPLPSLVVWPRAVNKGVRQGLAGDPKMLRLKVLGGGRRVGKSALLVEGSKTRFLMDYGVDISGSEPEFPLHVRPRDLDFVVITHAHLDHSGAAPLLYVSAKPKLYCTGTHAGALGRADSRFPQDIQVLHTLRVRASRRDEDGAVVVEFGDEIEERGVDAEVLERRPHPGQRHGRRSRSTAKPSCTPAISTPWTRAS